jgi:hypothetical protein
MLDVIVRVGKCRVQVSAVGPEVNSNRIGPLLALRGAPRHTAKALANIVSGAWVSTQPWSTVWPDKR